ncbi:MAG: HEAT repeat domain-containing protein [Planctomycetes bacterium]|nr:HEAT repeat domain-containing protein [Planctomycetota bacterium]
MIASCLASLPARPAAADTLTLKNGSKIDGKIEGDLATGQEIVLTFGPKARLSIPRWQVAAVEKNDRPGPNPAAPDSAGTAGPPIPAMVRDLVLVRAGRGGAAAAPSPVEYGAVLGLAPGPAEGSEQLEVQLPEKGTIRLSWRPAAAAEKALAGDQARPAPASLGASKIPTTHLIHLKNGRRIPGNPAAGPENEPLIVEIGSLGRLLIQRSAIDRIEARAGELEVPAELAEEGAPVTGPEAKIGPEAKAAEPVPLPPAAVEAGKAVPAIAPELEEEIQTAVYELTRQRTRNRTRAESHLKNLGAPALPYLARIADHPFQLARRAVMRIIGEIGEWQGVPIAIEGLADEDEYVRVHAGEALRRITHRDLGYEPYAAPKARLEAQKRWKEYYQEKLAAGEKK